MEEGRYWIWVKSNEIDTVKSKHNLFNESINELIKLRLLNDGIYYYIYDSKTSENIFAYKLWHFTAIYAKKGMVVVWRNIWAKIYHILKGKR